MAIAFSDTTNKAGLIQLCEIYTGLGDGSISGNTTLLKQFTRLINNGFQKLVTIILESEDDVQWDDASITGTYPTATRSLVSGQRDYKFSTALWSLIGVEGGAATTTQTITPLSIRRVDVSYDGTNYYRAIPFDSQETSNGLGNDTITDARFSTLNPRYDAGANGLSVYPRATASGGIMRIEFNREGTEFASSDTTKTLPIDTAFGPMPALDASIDFVSANAPSRVPGLQIRYSDLEQRLRKHYGRKDSDRQYQFGAAYVNYN